MDLSRRTRFAIHGGGIRIDPQAVDLRRSALLLIDMQYLDADPNYGQGLEAQQKGVFEEQYGFYFASLPAVIQNQQRLLASARAAGVQVVHTRIGALTQDGRDVSRPHKTLRVLAEPGSREIEFLDELAPMPNEPVLTKGASGAFNSTAIDQVLRNLGVDTLFVAGVVTNYCVETTVRDASDRGFDVLLIGDACASYSEDLHETSLEILDGAYCSVTTTEAVSSVLAQAAKAAVAAAAHDG
jgi:nicotinamidase-related amidase